MGLSASTRCDFSNLHLHRPRPRYNANSNIGLAHRRWLYSISAAFSTPPGSAQASSSTPTNEFGLGPQKRWREWDDLYAEWPAGDPLKYYWYSLLLEVRTPVYSAKSASEMTVQSLSRR